MKGRVLLVSRVGEGRTAAALLEDGELEDFAIDPPVGISPLGRVVTARIGRPAPGKNVWFGTAGEETLYIRTDRPLRQGSEVEVQLGAYAEAGKARPASTEILWKSRFVVLTPGRPGVNVSRRIRDTDEGARLRLLLEDYAGEGGGLIVRTAAEGQDEDTLVADAEALLAEVAAGEAVATAQRLAEAEWLAVPPDWIGYGGGLAPLFPSLDGLAREGDGDPFEALGVWDALGAALQPRVELPGGAWMAVEPTRALVAVDVNTGADFSPAGALKANIAALRDLPRALRLRGLGGQVTVDLAPLAKKDRRQAEGALKAAFRRDPVETTLAGWTPLGHLELQRKRERWPVTPDDIPQVTS